MSDTLADLERQLGWVMFPCDCGDHRHGLVIGVEGEGDIYLELAHFPMGWLNRMRAAWKILRYGTGGIDLNTMIVTADNVLALCDTIANVSSWSSESAYD